MGRKQKWGDVPWSPSFNLWTKWDCSVYTIYWDTGVDEKKIRRSYGKGGMDAAVKMPPHRVPMKTTESL